MKRTLLVTATALLVCAAGLLAQVKIIHFKDGRTPVIGEVTKKDDVYQVRTKMGSYPVKVSDVAIVLDYTSPELEYPNKLLALTPDDMRGRYALADWC